MADRKILTGLTAEAFTSDADHWALDKLKKVPLFPTIVQKFFEYGFDRWLYCMNMSMSVRCGPNQYKTLYGILEDACRVMDMPVPELYVTSNPKPNAFAGGVERPFITVHSSMINNLSDEQLYFLIGHELGHIKCEHVLYFSVASVLVPILDLIGKRTFGTSDLATYALILALYEWSRQAEFSADRAGLLASQSINDSIGSLVSLTAGPNRMSGEMSQEAFLDQARAYQDMDTLDEIGKIVIFMLWGKEFTHPMPVHRAQELDRWHHNGRFEEILAGKYARNAA